MQIALKRHNVTYGYNKDKIRVTTFPVNDVEWRLHVEENNNFVTQGVFRCGSRVVLGNIIAGILSPYFTTPVKVSFEE